MTNVKQMAAMIENRASAMSDELRRFLDLVWTHRDAIITTGPGSAGKIYNLYARRPQFASGATMSTVLPFLKNLEPLSRHPRAKPLGIQGLEDDPDPHIADFIYALERAIADGTANSEETEGLLWLCGNTFYHMPCEAALPSAGRIYLHVPVAFCVEVMTFVIRDLVTGHPEVLKAKLAGPCNVGADRIVIWVADPDRIDGALIALANFQAMHRGYFGEGVPRLCKEVTQAGGKPLRGVGVATEPGGGVSFGKSRTTPVFEALDALFAINDDWRTARGAQSAAGKEKFIALALATLRDKNIDPAHVHI